MLDLLTLCVVRSRAKFRDALRVTNRGAPAGWYRCGLRLTAPGIVPVPHYSLPAGFAGQCREGTGGYLRWVVGAALLEVPAVWRGLARRGS
jgi:hypothetical protein